MASCDRATIRTLAAADVELPANTGWHSWWLRAAVPTLAVLAGALVVGRVWCLAYNAGEPLRVAINPWPGYEFAALADELGYFADEGLDVQLIEQYSLSDTSRTFERGRVDGLFCTLVEIVQSRRHGVRQPQVVMVADVSSGSDVIIASPDTRGVRDLAGKRIGVELGTLSEYVLARSLELAGLEPDSVQRVHLPAIEMPEELASGGLDAAVCYPPASQVIAGRGGKIVFSSAQLPGEVIDVLAFDAATLRERPDDVEAFQRAYFRAQRFYLEHPERACQIMAARARLAPAAFQQHLSSGLRIVTEAEQADYLGERGSLSATIRRVEACLARSVSWEVADPGSSTPSESP